MQHKGIFLLMILNLLLLSTSYTIVMPFIPVYLDKELNANHDYLSIYSGACYAITFITAAFISPLWGRFADKSGKKIMLLRVSFLLTLSYVGCFLATTPFELFLARAFQGFASGMSPAVLSIISGFTVKEKAGLYMGIAQSSNLAGTILGPAIGGFLVTLASVKTCFMITSIIAAFITVLNIIFAKEPPSDNKECKKLLPDNLSFKELFNLNGFKKLLLANACGATVIMLLVPVVAMHVDFLLNHAYNSMEYAGLIFSASGLAGIAASPLWGFLCTKYQGRFVLSWALFGSSLFYGMQTFQNQIVFFTIFQFLAGLFICGIAPTVHTLIAQTIPASHHAKAYALTYAFQQGGNCIGPIAASIMLYFFSSNFAFTLASVFLFITGFLMLKTSK